MIWDTIPTGTSCLIYEICCGNTGERQEDGYVLCEAHA